MNGPAELSPPRPTEFAADKVAEFVFTSVVAVIALVAIAYAVHLLRRTGSWLPILCCIGGAITITIEPLIDSHLQLWWGDFRQPDIISAWGRHVPVMAGVIVLWYYGAGAYLTWMWLQQKGPRFNIWVLYGSEVGTALVMEPAAIKLDLWRYFGNHGIEVFGYPIYWPFIAAACSAASGVILYKLTPYLAGWRVLASVALVPMTVAAVYWACGWPMYIAINISAPQPVLCLLNAVSIGLGLLVVWLCTVATGNYAVPQEQRSAGRSATVTPEREDADVVG
jgi:hypothetical protein